MNKIIAVANQKGGVGKTTTAINLSAALAVKNRRVLLIDLDPQGMSTLGLAKPKENGKGVYQAMMIGRDLMDCIQGTELENLYLCPCSPELSGVEAELYASERRERRLSEAVEKARRYFNFIIIDCPPSLSMLTLNGLCAAHGVIIPMQCEYFAMEGLADLVNTIKRVAANLNPDLRIIGLLRVMFDPRMTLQQQVSEQLVARFGDKVFATIIPRNVRLAEAPSYGLPGVAYDRSSKGAQAYVAFGAEVIQRLASM